MVKILMVLAVICFVLAAFNVPSPLNLIAVGLALWAVTPLVS